MDGVICNFNKSVCDLFSIDWLYVEKNWTLGNYSIAQELGVSGNTIWAKINQKPSFWEDIEIYDYSLELIQLLRSKYEVVICTSPSSNADCPTGKLKWLRKHNLKFGNNVVITTHKHLLANTKNLLIDDSDKKIEDFRNNSGSAFTWPQKWNLCHNNIDRRMEILKSALNL